MDFRFFRQTESTTTTIVQRYEQYIPLAAGSTEESSIKFYRSHILLSKQPLSTSSSILPTVGTLVSILGQVLGISLIQIAFPISMAAPEKRGFSAYMGNESDLRSPALKKIALELARSTEQQATATVDGGLSDEQCPSTESGRNESEWDGVCSIGYRDTGSDGEDGKEREVDQEVGGFL